MAPYHAVLDCYAKTATLAMPSLPLVVWQGLIRRTLVGFISCVWAQWLISTDCLAYEAHVHDVSIEAPFADSVLVVSESPDVFPADLPRLPPNKDVDFANDLDPGTKPIYIPIPPY